MRTHRFRFGFNVTCSILLPVILCGVLALFITDDVFSAQTAPQSFAEIVIVKQRRFVDYHQTFVNFGKSASGSADEYEVAMALGTVASRTGEYLAAIHTLLEIYSDLSCGEDRARVRPLIERELVFYSELTGPSIEEADLNIAHTKMPGVAAEGMRMRDDLREVKRTVDSIRLR